MIYGRHSQQLSTWHESFDPFFTLHREMNCLFGDVFRGFGPLGRLGSPLMEGQFGWPRAELSETDKAVTVSAELPGLRSTSCANSASERRSRRDTTRT